MSDEAVNELTERVAGMVETIAAGGQVDMRSFRIAVLEVCQLAQGGAGVRPVNCHIIPAGFLAPLEPGAGTLWPIYDAEGVALRVDSAVPQLQRDHPPGVMQLNLGDSAPFLAHELLAAQSMQAGLAARRRL